MISLKTLFGDEAEILYQQNFQLLLLANILPPLGAGLLSPILDSLIDPFGASTVTIGLMVSAFTAPAIVVIPIIGILSDRYGRKPILVSALVLFGLAGMSIAFTTDFRIALFLRVLQGVAFGGLTPVIVTGIGDLYESTQEAAAQGFRFTGSGLISTTFPLLSSILVVLAWQYPFLVYSIAIPVAGAVYLWFDEPTDVRSSKPPSEEVDIATQIRALIDLVKQPLVFAMVIGRGLPMLAWIGIITYNSIVVIRVIGGTPLQAGLLVGIGSLTYATAASQAGRITAFFDSRFYPLVGCNICLGVGFALFHLASSLRVAGVGIVIVGAGFGLSLSMYRSIITGLATEDLRGGLVSLAESFGRVTSTLAPILMGGIISLATPAIGHDPAIRVAGVAVALLCSGGGIACLLVARNAPAVRV